jgi:AcrR family transcriptional regulator
MSDTPERVDRRRARTRAALLQAGQTLFAARSVDGVTIDDIVAEADVAKGSFYNHFPDKDALAGELANRARSRVEALAARLGAGIADPAERVARAVCGFARQALEDPLGVRVQHRLFQGAAIPDAPPTAGGRVDVQARLQAGRFSANGLAAGVLLTVGVVQIAVARVLSQDDARKAAALSRELAFGLLRGLGLDASSAQEVVAKAAADIYGGPSQAG